MLLKFGREPAVTGSTWLKMPHCMYIYCIYNNVICFFFVNFFYFKFNCSTVELVR